MVRIKELVFTAVILIISFVFGVVTEAAESYTYTQLVQRYVDLEHLAVLPEPEEKGAMWSSYDRKSVYDQATGKYVDWFANYDGFGSIRKEGKQIVMAEMEGPGCIWRIWSAWGKGENVKIYLDDKEISGQIDLYDQRVVPTGYIDLGKHKLTKGDHTFTIEIVGTSSKRAKGYIVGLDEIILTPVE